MTSKLKTRKDVFDSIVDVISSQFDVSKKSITEETDAVKDLGADELDCVEIVIGFEDMFGIPIPEEDCEKFIIYSKDNSKSIKISKCVDYIFERLNAE